MKALKTLVAIALSAGGLGPAVTLGAVSAEHSESKAQIAEAASETRLYLDCSSFADWDNAESVCIDLYTGSGRTYKEATKAADNYWYVDADVSGLAGFQFIRCKKGDTNTRWNEGPWSSSKTNNYCKVTEWNNSGSWQQVATTWTVVGATSGNWTSETENISISLQERFNNEGLQFYSTSVTLTAGSVFKVKSNASSNNYYGYNAIETGSGSVISTHDVSEIGNDHNIKVENSGSYEIYMKPLAGKFWMQENSEATATAWATSFLSATGTICSTNGTSADHLSALEGIWSDQKDAFDALTLGARNIIKTGTANATVTDAHDRYVHIMTRYAGELDAFEDWEISGSRYISPIKDNNATLIIVVAAAIALTATGAFFLLRKKRKEQ